MSISEHELAAEQNYLDGLYGLVAEETVRLREQLAVALKEKDRLVDREVRVDYLRRRLAALGAADSGLCFGNMSSAETTTYLGRLGLFPDDPDAEPLLLDWRAPAARPFYCATAVNTMDLRRRRHFQCTRNRIDKVIEEFLDAQHTVDSVLMTALNAPRADTMRDIVSTIQADQDEILRDTAHGILVIDGGPGTGKTSVALHRIAYLLYTEAHVLARRGVLMVGPNARFLRYVSEVLPSLGETGVAFCTLAELYPGVLADHRETVAAHRIKGQARMLDVLTLAVADRQELPAEPVPIELDDVTVHLDAELCATARERARTADTAHNPARSVFLSTVVAGLTERAVAAIGAEFLEHQDIADVRTEIIAAPQLAVAADALWPRLTPQRLLGELYGSPQRIAAATPDWTEADRTRLHRTDATAWTEADAALLDELAELLGPLPPLPRRTKQETDIDEQEYAQGVLQILDHDLADDAEEQIRVVDLLDAGALAGRQEVADTRTLAERAMADREWTFGHVVVDEAQELSPMQWRVLHRRCPVRSMTVAGDLAQGASGPAAWDEVFAPGSWRLRTLHTNYRVPAPIMELAAAAVPGAAVPESLRGGEKPWRTAVPDLSGLADLVAGELAAARPGSLAVISAEPLALPEQDGLAVLTPAAAKGLEFDVVIVVEPQRIPEPADRYVALTRPTQRLGLVHTEPLPAGWEQFAEPR